MLWLTAVAALVLVSTVLGSLLLWFRRRYDAEGNELVDAVEGLLPHTQCAQCGYPGCRPYAEAVVDGAPLDLCPPGGEATFKALQDLLGKYEGTAPAEPAASIARVREDECIGCFLCVNACPVDAIVGAAGFMHTVIEGHCTGCELCVGACPVDCIEMRLEPGQLAPPTVTPHNPGLPCIACDLCTPACPVGILPQDLLWSTRAGDWNAAREGHLDRCIECGRCDAACPSRIPLAETFRNGKRQLEHLDAMQELAGQAKVRVDARIERLIANQAEESRSRSNRLTQRGDASW